MNQAVQHFDAPMTVAEDNPAPMLDSIALCTPLLDLYRNTRLHPGTAA